MIEALPFKLNTEEAVDSFETWAKEKTPVLVAPPLLSLTPYYLPFWVFQTTVRTTHAGGVVEDATPRPSLQCYAGHTFRRSVTSVLKTQVAEAVPFRTDMLNGVGAHVELDARGKISGNCKENQILVFLPFLKTNNSVACSYCVLTTSFAALFESTAWSLVKEAVLAEEIERFGAGCTCVFGTVKSRQVLLPCFIAQYQVFGQTFRAYINGTTGK